MDYLSSYPEYDPQSLPQISSNTSDDLCTFTLHFLNASAPASTFLGPLTAFFASLTASPHFPSSRPFIWHIASPVLRLSKPEEGEEFIEGEVRYGDSIEDEWFVVWCLREATRRWRDDGLTAGVKDGDGEFLLIEAAEALPKWVSPEVADGRVWIKNGALHLIPPFTEPVTSLTLAVGLHLLTSPSSASTLAPAAVADLVNARIEAASPARLSKEHLHVTTAYLQPEVVQALRRDPQLVSEAVRAFYERDPQGVKAAHSMRRFPPGDIPSTPTRLQLTRPLYAQILHQRFHSPKSFSQGDWFPSEVKEGSDEWRRREVGMKVVVGFEMAWDAAMRAREGSASEVDFVVKVADALRGVKELEEAGNPEEDSDAWLTVSESQLDDLMSSKAPSQSAAVTPLKAEDDATAKAEAAKMRDFASKLEGFVSGKGAFSGALMDDDSGSDLDSGSDEEDSEQDDLAADLDMLDEEGRSRGGKKGRREEKERRRRMDGLVKGLGAGEWGAKTQNHIPVPIDERMDKAKEKPRTKPSDVEMVDVEIGSSAAKASAKASKPATDASATADKISAPRLARPTYDGYVSESSDEDEAPLGEDEGAPAIADLGSNGRGANGQGANGQAGAEEGGVDMGEEEDEFLAFARDALGLTEEQYEAILDSRRSKGAYVPASGKTKPPASTAMDVDPMPAPSKSKSKARTNGSSKGPVSNPKLKGKGVRFTEPAEASAIPPSSHTLPSVPVASGAKGPNFASFDALMEQMDAELKKAKGGASKPSSSRGGPVKAMEPDLGEDSDEDEDGDFDSAMDAELAELLKKSGSGEEGLEGNYGLVANFLESFKAQAGMAGPVGNLAGLMGVDLPAWKE